jgi:hypothetical protein
LKKIVFAFLVCFFSGAIWGVGGLSFSGKPLHTSIKDILELGSYCATIFVALIGVKTLTAWQLQFKHAEKYKAIKSFQDKLNGEQVGESYLYSVMQKVIDSINQSAPIGLLDGVKFFKERDLAWVYHCFEMQRAWEEMRLFLTDVELKCFSISPVDLEGRVWDAYMVMLKKYDDKNGDAAEMFRICRGAVDRLKEDFSKLRLDTNGLIKIVLG